MPSAVTRPDAALPSEVAALQAQIDGAACGLLQTDADGLLLRVNRTFCNWLGYTPEELEGRQKMQNLLTMGGKIFYQTHWAPLLQMQGSVSEVRLEVVHKDGHLLPMVMNSLRREAGGAVRHEVAAFIARDRDKFEQELILSRKRAEGLAAEAHKLQAEAKDQALFAEQMVGIVSHDLRNPLSTILMATTVLMRGEVSPNQLRVLTRISHAGNRANRLITDLLDFTQARLGKGIAIRPQSIDLCQMVHETVEELALAFPARRLQHTHAGEGFCNADADRMAQMVGNLVANAIAYGEVDTPVTVRSSVDAAGFSIAVHNEGPPIPQEKIAALFQPMVRGEAEGKGGSSVGLGLYIVSEIAKAHAGTVSVASHATDGTTFTASFPEDPHATSPS